jgi:phage portal protein BeeE
MYTGESENALVLNNGITFKEAGATSTELQLNESSNRLQNQINDLFHISDNFDLTFKLAVYPIMKAFETALNRDLLLEKEKNRLYFEFDTKEIIRANLKERYEAYKLAKDTGFLTINEIRTAENMNSIEGMDVINVGLGSVLYDVNNGTYYTPNNDTVSSPNDETPVKENPEENPEEKEEEK